MSNEKPFELGWYGMGKESDLELAKFAVSEERGLINQESAQNGYVTVTLYPNHLFFILFRKNKPPKRYSNAVNASIISIVDGEFTIIQHRELVDAEIERRK
jgi:hypothetical protein